MLIESGNKNAIVGLDEDIRKIGSKYNDLVVQNNANIDGQKEIVNISKDKAKKHNTKTISNEKEFRISIEYKKGIGDEELIDEIRENNDKALFISVSVRLFQSDRLVQYGR
ncbi:21225_t:CDS:2 [Gigaspora margarita]|uniref:21225_t:CDS:1 n=1 Tax=Gigaspora margarita TaxID=4874 RepID=A0ABN7W961_GIGMA|nr:21225_t:CDS:2 [Gigaspora margarita]